jgi:hypothetical protein
MSRSKVGFGIGLGSMQVWKVWTRLEQGGRDSNGVYRLRHTDGGCASLHLHAYASARRAVARTYNRYAHSLFSSV